MKNREKLDKELELAWLAWRDYGFICGLLIGIIVTALSFILIKYNGNLCS